MIRGSSLFGIDAIFFERRYVYDHYRSLAEYNPFHNGHVYHWQKLNWADYRDYERRFRPARRTLRFFDQPDRAGLALLAAHLCCSFRVTLRSAVHSISHAGRYRFTALIVSIFSALAVNTETRRRFWNSLMFCSMSRRNTVSCSPVCSERTLLPDGAHRHFPLIFLTALPSLRFQKKNLIPF